MPRGRRGASTAPSETFRPASWSARRVCGRSTSDDPRRTRGRRRCTTDRPRAWSCSHSSARRGKTGQRRPPSGPGYRCAAAYESVSELPGADFGSPVSSRGEAGDGSPAVVCHQPPVVRVDNSATLAETPRGRRDSQRRGVRSLGAASVGRGLRRQRGSAVRGGRRMKAVVDLDPFALLRRFGDVAQGGGRGFAGLAAQPRGLGGA